MSSLTSDQIRTLLLGTAAPQPIEIPGLGLVYYRPMTSAQAAAVRALPAEDLSADHRTLIWCCTDAAGNPVFTEADLPEVLRLDFRIVSAFATAVFARGKEVAAAAGKTAPATPESADSSTSPSPSTDCPPS